MSVPGDIAAKADGKRVINQDLLPSLNLYSQKTESKQVLSSAAAQDNNSGK